MQDNRPKKSNPIFVAILSGLIIGLVAGLYISKAPVVENLSRHIPFSDDYFSDGISPVVEAKPIEPNGQQIRILFIGNSYTFFNNMPLMLAHIAESDPDNHAHYTIQSVTLAGKTLEDVWKEGQAQKLIHQKQWDYVVLQDQSFWALHPNWIGQTTYYAELFNNEIKQAGAHTVLFTTWARQPGTSWYSDPQYNFLRNPIYMQDQFDSQTNALADKLSATAIPAGDYWAKTLARNPSFPLYEADGTHPSQAGAYVNALAFYKYFSEHAPSRVTYTPHFVSAEQAKFLRDIISAGN